VCRLPGVFRFCVLFVGDWLVYCVRLPGEKGRQSKGARRARKLYGREENKKRNFLGFKGGLFMSTLGKKRSFKLA